MIERDYIMRMIRMLTSSLAKILFHKDLQQYDEAIKEIDEASEHLIGMKWEFLRSFSDEQLIDLLGSTERKDKLIVAAELLRMESEILFDQGKLDEGSFSGMKAFSLFAEVIIQDVGYLDVMHAEKFASLLNRLEQYELPPSLNFKRARFYEIRGQFAAAEETLLSLIEHDAGLVDEGVAFYKRVLTKDDEEMRKSGLSREMALKGLARLESILRNGQDMRKRV